MNLNITRKRRNLRRTTQPKPLRPLRWQHLLSAVLLSITLLYGALLPVALATETAAPEAPSVTPTCQGDCVAVGDWQFSISIGYGIRTNPVFQQDDIPYVIVPEFSYYGKRFFLENFDLGFTAYDKGEHQFNLLFFTPGFEQAFFDRWNLRNFDLTSPVAAASPIPTSGLADEFNSNQDRPLPGIQLGKRRTAVLSGFEYTYIHPNFDWQTQILQDISGLHHGQKIRTAVTLPWRQQRNFFELSAGLTWKSGSLIDYYYGIDTDEVYSDDLVYQAPASTTFYTKLEWERRLNKHWGLRGLVSYRWLDEAITNSPIVEESGVATVFFAGVYHF